MQKHGLRKEDIIRLEAFEMWIWRRMEKTVHTSNEEVLKLVEGLAEQTKSETTATLDYPC